MVEDIQILSAIMKFNLFSKSYCDLPDIEDQTEAKTPKEALKYFRNRYKLLTIDLKNLCIDTQEVKNG